MFFFTHHGRRLHGKPLLGQLTSMEQHMNYTVIVFEPMIFSLRGRVTYYDRRKSCAALIAGLNSVAIFLHTIKTIGQSSCISPVHICQKATV